MAVFNSHWRLSFCQPSLTKRSSALASSEEEVKIRAARFCSFCSLMETDLLQFPHTIYCSVVYVGMHSHADTDL